MKASECYVGMKATLPMEWATGENETRHKPVETATCIYIPDHKRYAVFQFRSGIKETVYLEDASKLACNCGPEVLNIPAEFIHRKKKPATNNEKIEDALIRDHVTKMAVSKAAGRSGPYLSARMKTHEMNAEETAYWLEMIHSMAQEDVPLDESDPYYPIKAAMKECELSSRAASRLLGYNEAWLSQRMKKPMDKTEQDNIAASIRKRALKPPERAERGV